MLDFGVVNGASSGCCRRRPAESARGDHELTAEPAEGLLWDLRPLGQCMAWQGDVMSFEPTHHERMRHRDCGTWLVEFSGRMLGVCPRCRGRALVAPRPGVTALEYFSELFFQPRRLACAGCGVVADWRAAERDGGLAGAVPGGTEDPFFRRSLWLQTRVRDRFCGPTTKRMLLPLPTPWVRGCVSVVLLRRGRCSPGCRPGRRRQSIARRCWQAWQLSWLLLNGRPPRTVPMPPTNAETGRVTMAACTSAAVPTKESRRGFRGSDAGRPSGARCLRVRPASSVVRSACCGSGRWLRQLAAFPVRLGRGGLAGHASRGRRSGSGRAR